MLIVLYNLQRKTWCVGVENVAQFSTSFIHGGRRKAGVELTRNREHSVRGSPLCHTRESGRPAGRDAAAQGLRLAGVASSRNSVSVVVSWMPAFAGMTQGKSPIQAPVV